MYTKKMLSVATAVALLTTGLMAFESNIDGIINNGGDINASYTNGVLAENNLTLSDTQRGDALIYPFYRTTGGWESEIVVRNTTQRATVAKVVLYGHQESEELFDFNIYLSPFDVFRFTISEDEEKSGEYKIMTKDGSIPTSLVRPENGVKYDIHTVDGVSYPSFNPHNGDAFEIGRLTGTKAIAGQKGYAVIYGMTQYQEPADTLATPISDLKYHKKHTEIWADYRRILDDCRPGWRAAFSNNDSGFSKGMIKIDLNAPNTETNCSSNDQNITLSNDESNSTLVDGNLSKWGDVNETTLTGTVRILNGQDDDSANHRDLLIPATALANFTDGNMMLWTAGEYAAIQDRDINASGDYNETAIRNDAQTFLKSATFYTYTEQSVANKLLVTQPLKRVLIQLGNDDGYWPIVDGARRGFQLSSLLLDEDERFDGDPAVSISVGNITSPLEDKSVTAQVSSYINEVEEISNFQDNATDSYFKTTDGFAYMNFSNTPNKLPAIVTQMTGSKINGVSPMTNWIYAPTIK